MLCESRRAVGEAMRDALDSSEGLECLGVARTYRAARQQLEQLNTDVVVVALDFHEEEIRQLAMADPQARIAFLADPVTVQMRALVAEYDNLDVLPAVLSFEDLVDTVRSADYSGSDPVTWPECLLTPREFETLALLVQGFNAAAMADHLHVSIHTSRFHIKALLSKLGVNTQAEAILAGIERGLVSPPPRALRS